MAKLTFLKADLSKQGVIEMILHKFNESLQLIKKNGMKKKTVVQTRIHEYTCAHALASKHPVK